MPNLAEQLRHKVIIEQLGYSLETRPKLILIPLLAKNNWAIKQYLVKLILNHYHKVETNFLHIMEIKL